MYLGGDRRWVPLSHCKVNNLYLLSNLRDQGNRVWLKLRRLVFGMYVHKSETLL